ncbi:hypothetical protein CEUSTIGMA_g1668.t1 [Chlamydomonas eustigma]|uniref:RAI1-like domain-containing protein n=1 Tax=Chlamydomonas eustigma TaxID=1157962 RepID=A0A250WU13_9CHLO|nr:hypothetical protein CEUSTIGMA_g1668.t1 [Chlamydomonas eustigma]|eukprot:GAX74219.1 hypothetical protein CEUSTIGMA_g1668.t1 [Chlamydomonas eustigma]
MTHETFSVQSWLSNDQPELIDITKPAVINYWSKLSTKDGGSYQYGSKSGMPTFSKPQLPVDLNSGYPHAFVRKENDTDSTPVEVVIRATQHADVSLSQISVCTFRNNLNKILLTLINRGDAWAVDA